MNYTIFLAGVTTATFAASSIFFLKLWINTQDRFFCYFATACAFLSAERIAALFVQGILDPSAATLPESSSWIYLLRLFAFTMILLAIIGKNSRKKI